MRVLQCRSLKNGRAYKDTVVRVRFNADGSTLTARFENGIGLTAMDSSTGRVLEFPFLQGPRPTCHAYSWDGEYLAIGDTRGVTRPYRLSDKSMLAELVPQQGSAGIRDVTFAPCREPLRQWLAVCGAELWVWNPVTQQYLVAPEREWFIGSVFDSAVESITVLSRVGVTRFRLRPFVSLWQVPLERLTGRATYPQLSKSQSLLAATDSSLVVGDGRALHILDSTDGKWRDTIRPATPIRDIAFLPNSRLLAVADGSPTLRVYDTDTGTVAREYDWGIGGIHCVTFSHDGAMGAAGGDKGRVVVWDVE